MPGEGAPSEFGGKIQENGIQPFPHEPTASEKLSLLYRTGQTEDPALKVDEEGVVWRGLLPEAEQRAIREGAGDMDRGEVWEDMQG